MKMQETVLLLTAGGFIGGFVPLLLGPPNQVQGLQFATIPVFALMAVAVVYVLERISPGSA